MKKWRGGPSSDNLFLPWVLKIGNVDFWLKGKKRARDEGFVGWLHGVGQLAVHQQTDLAPAPDCVCVCEYCPVFYFLAATSSSQEFWVLCMWKACFLSRTCRSSSPASCSEWFRSSFNTFHPLFRFIVSSFVLFIGKNICAKVVLFFRFFFPPWLIRALPVNRDFAPCPCDFKLQRIPTIWLNFHRQTTHSQLITLNSKGKQQFNYYADCDGYADVARAPSNQW